MSDPLVHATTKVVPMWEGTSLDIQVRRWPDSKYLRALSKL